MNNQTPQSNRDPWLLMEALHAENLRRRTDKELVERYARNIRRLHWLRGGIATAALTLFVMGSLATIPTPDFSFVVTSRGADRASLCVTAAQTVAAL